MNLQHLKYAVEVAKASSITKAAENLYMGQPNLSRSIRELEESLGITLFKRSSKGIVPTADGEEFLAYARKILAQVDAVEALYQGEKRRGSSFSLSAPRAAYIAQAFASFVRRLPAGGEQEFCYKETNARRTVHNILNADYKLGILRYRTEYEHRFSEMMNDRGLACERILDFRRLLLLSREHPLAEAPVIRLSDLAAYTELSEADPYVPNLPVTEVRKAELTPGVSSHVFLYERSSRDLLLQTLPGAFAWASPLCTGQMRDSGLIMRAVEDDRVYMRDVLVYRREYHLTDRDHLFTEELIRAKRDAQSAQEGIR